MSYLGSLHKMISRTSLVKTSKDFVVGLFLLLVRTSDKMCLTRFYTGPWTLLYNGCIFT